MRREVLTVRPHDRFELLAKEMNGGLTGEGHAGIHAFPADGIEWRLAQPPKGCSRRVRWEDGSDTVQG